MRASQQAVRGDAVALGEDDEVAAHDLAAGDAPLHAVADDERPWAREVSQRFQRSLGAPLLDDGDGHDDEDEAEQHQRHRPARP